MFDILIIASLTFASVAGFGCCLGAFTLGDDDVYYARLSLKGH
jgi:hypothetical protein